MDDVLDQKRLEAGRPVRPLLKVLAQDWKRRPRLEVVCKKELHGYAI